MSELSKGGLRTLREEPFAVLVGALIVAIVLFGIALRARGVLDEPLPLWLDEADWAISLITRPLSEHLIRPIGFMAITKLVVTKFSAAETSLRALPFLAGVGATVLAPFLARLLFRAPASRLLFVAIIALHPGAIDLSKEFKPYAASLAVHLLMLYVVLRYDVTSRARDLGLALGVLVLGVLMAQDVVFAYPALFLVLGLRAYREKRVRHLAATAAGAAIALGVVLGLYLFIWSRLGSGESGYWGEKYDVFYVGDAGAPGKLEWTLSKYRELVELPGVRRTRWETGWALKTDLQILDSGLWLALHALGLAVLAWQRRLRDALLLVTPVGLMAVFNWLGHWPFGEFRTNLFVLTYVGAIAATAFDARRPIPARFAAVSPALVLVLVPLFLFESEWHWRKHWFAGHGTMPRVLEKTVELRSKYSRKHRELLVLDEHSGPTWTYYTKYHPDLSRRFGHAVERLFEVRHDGASDQAERWIRAHLAEGHGRAWYLVAKHRTYRTAARTWLYGLSVRRKMLPEHYLLDVRTAP